MKLEACISDISSAIKVSGGQSDYIRVSLDLYEADLTSLSKLRGKNLMLVITETGESF